MIMTLAQNNTPPSPKPSGKNSSQTTACATQVNQPHHPESGIKCPRCDFSNTKFCYYNNYSLAQPRHFCKTCRRYWTNGGALRNVPIGGGCRKNKKSAPYLSSSTDNNAGGGNGLRLFQGLSPAMDFQVNYYGGHVPAKPNCTAPSLLNQLSSSFGDIPENSGRLISTANPTCFGTTVLDAGSGIQFCPPLLGYNFPMSSKELDGGNLLGFQDVGPTLTSSIESLSYINQNLHWKLQQQRLGLLFVGNNKNNKDNTLVPSCSQKPEPVLHQNMEISSGDESCTVVGATSSKDNGANGDLSTDWFFGNYNSSYSAHVDQTQRITGNNDLMDENSSINWSGFQTWTGFAHFPASDL